MELEEPFSFRFQIRAVESPELGETDKRGQGSGLACWSRCKRHDNNPCTQTQALDPHPGTLVGLILHLTQKMGRPFKRPSGAQCPGRAEENCDSQERNEWRFK